MYIHTNCIATTHSYITGQLHSYLYLRIAHNCTTAQVVWDVCSWLVMSLATYVATVIICVTYLYTGL